MSKIDNPSLAGHVIEDEGTPLAQRKNLNFIGVSVTVTDNPGADSTDVTLSGSGTSSSRAFAYFIS